MNFAVLDFETTGNQWDDQIIQVGLAIIEDEKITKTYSSYVNPMRPIPDFITKLTGIREEDVKDAPTAEEMLLELLPLLEGKVLVAHNAPFDVGFLQKTLRQNGYEPFSGRVLDTVDFIRICFPTLSSLQLSAVSSALDVVHERPHQADSDAQATARIWLLCLKRLKEFPLLTLQRLNAVFAPENGDISWFLAHILKEREKSPYSRMEEETVNAFRQFCIKVSNWSEERCERTEEEKAVLAGRSFSDFYLDVQKALKETFPDYERRDSQERMMEEVYHALENGSHLMVEAGTGTGKSLGYLIPALYYGIRNDAKITVSTHTLHLQDQLRHRDLPLIQKIFPIPVRVAVLKGRNHYLCLRKFEQRIHRISLSEDREDRVTAAQMIVWLGETEGGEDEELNLNSRGKEFWQSVASDANSCLNRSCPWFRKCFYHRAKHQANMADVVITNHSLLFTDMKADHRILPYSDHLIVDEAHHLEEVASKHLGLDISYYGLVNALQRMYKDARSGLLPLLRRLLAQMGDERADEVSKAIGEAEGKIVQAKEQWDALTEQVYHQLVQLVGESAYEGVPLSFRFKPSRLPEGWDAVKIGEENIRLTLGEIIRQGQILIESLEDADAGYDLQSLLTDLNGAVKDLVQFREALRFFMDMNDENSVYWLEADPYSKGKSLQFICLPVDVSSMLDEHIFRNKESVVLASATLSVNRSFHYFIEQLGLSESQRQGRLSTVRFDSHFDYRKQALVLVPKDFPSVKEADDSRYLHALVDSLKDAAVELNGKMLVLFTSYQMLRWVYEPLKERFLPYDIEVFAQGVNSQNRSKLIQQFQESRAGVLLGTNSYWEGVDIPGKALSCLAIVRLPFQPPNHPLVEAKCENLRKMRQNPFMKYSVPQAVIRFKQGFGRLVRSKQDRGVVIVYDTRVIETQYGKYFLSSLPEPNIELVETKQIVPRIREWMVGEQRGDIR